jgi:hypothetical protein
MPVNRKRILLAVAEVQESVTHWKVRQWEKHFPRFSRSFFLSRPPLSVVSRFWESVAEATAVAEAG